MEFISKYNLTFVKFINKKYNKHFKNFEQYGLYLFELNNCNDNDYYYQLEKDIREYSDFQTERKYNDGKSERKNTQ